MDIPKSKSSIWEVRNRNVDLGMSQIKFGTKVNLGYNIAIILVVMIIFYDLVELAVDSS